MVYVCDVGSSRGGVGVDDGGVRMAGWRGRGVEGLMAATWRVGRDNLSNKDQ